MRMKIKKEQSKPKSVREVYFEEEGFRKSLVYERKNLSPGTSIPGPALVEEVMSTSVIPPKSLLKIDKYYLILNTPLVII